jgi:hypothetical protein
VSPVEWVGVVSLLYLLACALQYRYINNMLTHVCSPPYGVIPHMLPSGGVRVWVVYLTPKIERIISLLSTSPEGEVRCRCQNGMAYKD